MANNDLTDLTPGALSTNLSRLVTGTVHVTNEAKLLDTQTPKLAPENGTYNMVTTGTDDIVKAGPDGMAPTTGIRGMGKTGTQMYSIGIHDDMVKTGTHRNVTTYDQTTQFDKILGNATHKELSPNITETPLEDNTFINTTPEKDLDAYIPASKIALPKNFSLTENPPINKTTHYPRTNLSSTVGVSPSPGSNTTEYTIHDPKRAIVDSKLWIYILVGFILIILMISFTLYLMRKRIWKNYKKSSDTDVSKEPLTLSEQERAKRSLLAKPYTALPDLRKYEFYFSYDDPYEEFRYYGDYKHPGSKRSEHGKEPGKSLFHAIRASGGKFHLFETKSGGKDGPGESVDDDNEDEDSKEGANKASPDRGKGNISPHGKDDPKNPKNKPGGVPNLAKAHSLTEITGKKSPFRKSR